MLLHRIPSAAVLSTSGSGHCHRTRVASTPRNPHTGGGTIALVHTSFQFRSVNAVRHSSQYGDGERRAAWQPVAAPLTRPGADDGGTER